MMMGASGECDICVFGSHTFPHDCRFLTSASATSPDVVLTGALAPQGRARCVRSGNIALATFAGDPHGSSDSRRRIKGHYFLWLRLRQRLLLPSTLSLPLSRGHTAIAPCRNHLSPACRKTNSSWIPPRHIRALTLSPDTPRHTHAVLFCGRFRQTLISPPCRAGERVSLYL